MNGKVKNKTAIVQIFGYFPSACFGLHAYSFVLQKPTRCEREGNIFYGSFFNNHLDEFGNLQFKKPILKKRRNKIFGITL
jgi:hypothetical protein